MYQMMSDSTLEGTVMVAGEALNIVEMTQRIKESMEYPVSGHPTMRPDTGFVTLVSLL